MNFLPVSEAFLVCPACRSSLAAASASQLACAGCGLYYPVTDGIPNLLAPHTETGLEVGMSRSAVAEEARKHFEHTYIHAREPWEYTARAGEVLRHDYTRDLAAQLKPTCERILDVGCSLGQLTGRLYGLAPEIHGFDVSPVAVEKARQHCRRIAEGDPLQPPGDARSDFHFFIGSATDIPVREASCDLILLCDGLRSWQLDQAERRAILHAANRALKPDGFVILTEYLKNELFDTFLGWVRDSPLQISYVEHLPDRQWYQFASWFKAVRGIAPVRRMLASKRLARVIMAGSRRLGRYGSAHLAVVATRGPVTDTG